MIIDNLLLINDKSSDFMLLDLQNGRKTSREFHKVSLVKEIVRYRPRINNKNDAKCMDTYLNRAPESELVMTTLGPDIDYLPVQAGSSTGLSNCQY